MSDIVERLREQARPKGMEHRDVTDVLMSEAADEIERLRAWQDQHDCCMCGSRMSDHDIGSGHSPVSMYDYYQLQLEKRAEAAEAKLLAALDIAIRCGGIDGAHHKAWVIDQMVRALAGDDYKALIRQAKAGEDGPDTYEWDEGIAP